MPSSSRDKLILSKLCHPTRTPFLPVLACKSLLSFLFAFLPTWPGETTEHFGSSYMYNKSLSPTQKCIYIQSASSPTLMCNEFNLLKADIKRMWHIFIQPSGNTSMGMGNLKEQKFPFVLSFWSVYLKQNSIPYSIQFDDAKIWPRDRKIKKTRIERQRRILPLFISPAQRFLWSVNPWISVWI